MRASRQFKAKNGPLDCVQKNYQVSERKHDETTAEKELEFNRTSEITTDFANRLQKILRKLANGQSNKN